MHGVKGNGYRYHLLMHICLPVESVIITVALCLTPNVIPLLTDDKLNVTLKLSSPSTMSSPITGTLTLLIVIRLSNVAVSVVVSKSTPPISQTLFSQHIIIHITLLPSADTGNCSDGVTAILKGLLDIPFTNSSVTITNPVASEPVYCSCVNLTLISTINVRCKKYFVALKTCLYIAIAITTYIC